MKQKIFVSWAGPLAREIAELLRVWLKKVIPELELFVSSEDMTKGNVWVNELMKELVRSKMGIVCVTPESLQSKWVLFESGALTKRVGGNGLFTLLVDVRPQDLAQTPLAAFQSTTFIRGDVLRLLRSIRKAMKASLTEQELEAAFEKHWPELESAYKLAMSRPVVYRSPLAELTEDLLLPVIYREALQGELETAFEWLEITRKKGVAGLEPQLAFVEAALARLTGKRRARQSLRTQAEDGSLFSGLARLELSHLLFASGQGLDDPEVDLSFVERLPSNKQRIARALFGIWCWKDGDRTSAVRYLEAAQPEAAKEEIADIYCATVLGVLCFACGRLDQGERLFGIARRGPSAPTLGYPFASLVSEMDRAFVNACIGAKSKPLTDMQIRDFRGHAWVLIKLVDTMRNSPEIIRGFVEMSVNWAHPLSEGAVVDRFREIQRKLLAGAGAPL